VGGAEVGGTWVGGGTAVGGIGVTVTITAVGGAEVRVGSAAIPVVAVATIGCPVVTTVGGLPLAGNLQPAAPTARSTSSIQVKNTFLLIFASLEPIADIPMKIFYINL
jgi:hypothetical protein